MAFFGQTNNKSSDFQWIPSYLNMSSKLSLLSVKIRVRPLCRAMPPMLRCIPKTKHKFICCVLWLYDVFDDGNDNESIEIYNLHASSHVRSSIPVRWMTRVCREFKMKIYCTTECSKLRTLRCGMGMWGGVCLVHRETRNSLTALIKATSTASLRLDEWKIWTHNRLFILARRDVRAVCGRSG